MEALTGERKEFFILIQILNCEVTLPLFLGSIQSLAATNLATSKEKNKLSLYLFSFRYGSRIFLEVSVQRNHQKDDKLFWGIILINS